MNCIKFIYKKHCSIKDEMNRNEIESSRITREIMMPYSDRFY